MKETVYFPTTVSEGPAALYVLEQDGSIHPYELKDYARIGRNTSSSTADIRISAGIVSRNHGEIVRMPVGYIYRDLGSLNGTYINGQRIRNTVLLDAQDEIAVGELHFLFEL